MTKKFAILKTLLIEWQTRNPTDASVWLKPKSLWSHLLDVESVADTAIPFHSLQEFRYALHRLSTLEPGFLQVRRSGHCHQFHLVYSINGWQKQIKAIKSEAPKLPIGEQVKEQQESFLWKKRYRETKKLLDHSHSENILQKLILDQFHRDIVALPPAPFVSKVNKASGKRSPEEAMLVLSDAHVGEVVNIEETDRLCEYNFEIFVRRLQYIADTIDKLNKCKINVGLTKLTIAVLGDMCAGNIHEELEITNEAHIVTQACMGGYVFSQFLREISTMFPQVEVICLGGNHGRIQKQKRFKQKNLDWDRVFYEIAAAYSREFKNVSFVMPRSTYWVGDINGHTFLLFHGDHIRSWAGIPFYGVLRAVTNLKTQYAPHGRVIKYSVLGHFHTMGELADVHGDTILNGAFMGGNDFSIGAMAKVTYPGQHYFGIHPRIGRSWRYPLRLDTAPKDGEIRYKYDLDKSVADVVQQ